MPPSRCQHTARTQPQRRRNAALAPLHAALTLLHASLTLASRSLHAAVCRCSLSPRPPPRPYFALHNAPTPPQRRRNAAATLLHAALVPLQAALTQPSRSCTPLLTVPTPLPAPPRLTQRPTPPQCRPAPPTRLCKSPSCRDRAATLRRREARAPHIGRPALPLPVILGGARARVGSGGMEWRARRGRAG